MIDVADSLIAVIGAVVVLGGRATLALSLDTWTDAVGVALLVVVVAAAASIDRAVMSHRRVGGRLVTVAIASTVALVAVVVGRFVALA